MRDGIMRDGILLRRCAATAALLALPFAAAASGQNLAANPEFDVNVDGWGEFPDPSLTVDWSALDRNANPGSGSLRGLNSDSNAANLGVVSCVDSISEGESYQYSAFLRLPAGQSGSGDISLALYWYDGFACSGGALVGGFSNAVGAANQWFYVAVDPAVAPSGAVSAVLAVGINKGIGGTLAGHVDGVDFRVTLFRDGFESAGGDNWSFSIGLED
jgi:hypothetical protein